MREATYLVRNSAGTALGEWSHAPLPQFGVSFSGNDSLTVALPRKLGEPDTESLLMLGNKVEVWYTDESTLAEPLMLGLIEEHGIELAPIEASTAGSALVFLGTIEKVLQSQYQIQITVESLRRIIKTTPVWYGYSDGGDPIHIARRMAQALLVGVPWDAGNPESSGQNIEHVDLGGAFVEDSLNTLRPLWGAGWQWFVSPQGTLKIVQPPSEETVDHSLTLGSEALDPTFNTELKDSPGMVAVHYGLDEDENEDAIAYGDRYQISDPRALRISATHLLSHGDALTLAQLTLLERSQAVVSASVTVSSDVVRPWKFKLGQTVMLEIEFEESIQRVFAVETVGIEDGVIEGPASSAPLLIAAISYQGDRVRLELGQQTPRVQDQIAALTRVKR